jgi:prevent-host-death family protein
MRTVSASDANRQFSSLLREVSQGGVITVVSRGKVAAVIGPPNSKDGRREIAKRGLVERLRRQKASGARNWTRAELYD